MSADQVLARITEFIRESFLDADPKGELDEASPLLEWGVLNSMNTAVLLNFLREDLGVNVPPAAINRARFKNVGTITALVVELMDASGAARLEGSEAR